ncbi:hypothetical protein TYRP_016540 [Tyrophagus putrescentiae]|nr:hypothetical protein TYRP_016540 [Tyrophagus putrescentiae]
MALKENGRGNGSSTVSVVAFVAVLACATNIDDSRGNSPADCLNQIKEAIDRDNRLTSIRSSSTSLRAPFLSSNFADYTTTIFGYNVSRDELLQLSRASSASISMSPK